VIRIAFMTGGSESTDGVRPPADAAAELALVEARREVIEAMPAKWRESLPRDDAGEPILEVKYGLYAYARTAPNEVTWKEVRELDVAEWDAAIDAHRQIYLLTQDVDRFPSFAWSDLKATRAELHRQLREGSVHPEEWIAPLVEYRILGYSTALWMYYEYVMAELNRRRDEDLSADVKAKFSRLYDESFGYRLVFSLRNAFQHGVRSLVSLQAKVALVDGSDRERETEARAPLDKDKFVGSRANATVRREVRALNDDEELDLFILCEEAHTGVQDLHRRLAPLLHPDAPAAAKLLAGYMREVGNEQAHFHEYIRGVPHLLLGTHTLDRNGFTYVVEQIGGNLIYVEGQVPPTSPPGQGTFVREGGVN